jgi:hypothetical protein
MWPCTLSPRSVTAEGPCAGESVAYCGGVAEVVPTGPGSCVVRVAFPARAVSATVNFVAAQQPGCAACGTDYAPSVETVVIGDVPVCAGDAALGGGECVCLGGQADVLRVDAGALD